MYLTIFVVFKPVSRLDNLPGNRKSLYEFVQALFINGRIPGIVAVPDQRSGSFAPEKAIPQIFRPRPDR